MISFLSKSRLYQYGKELVGRFIENDVSGMSAQLAYYFMLSIFPFFIFAFTLIGYLPISAEHTLYFLHAVAPQKVTELLESNIHSILNVRRGWLLVFSLLGTLWTSSSAIHAIISALNRAYDVKEERSYVMSRMMAILFTIGMVLAIIVTLLLPVFGKTIETFVTSYIVVPENVLQLWTVVRWMFSFVFLIGLFAFIYYFAPNCKVHWRIGCIGAVFAAVGWLVVSYGFSFYVNSFSSYTITYGSLGGVIILMIWFYLSAMILILGGQINAMIQKYLS